MADDNNIDQTLEQQLDALFRKHGPMLVTAANGVLRNRDDAEDAVSNVFLKLSETVPPTTDFMKNPPGYLHQAVVNEAINMRRNRGFRQVTEHEVGNLKMPSSAIPSRALQDMLRRVIEAKSELDLGQVALLTLRYEMDLSCKEIAERLGRTRMGIGMSLARARRQMKKLILENAAETPRELKELKPNAGETQ
jgi:RNA polymerase sigma factor (sigma-70 family)